MEEQPPLLSHIRDIELIEEIGYKWRVRICESGKEIEVYEDEFILD